MRVQGLSIAALSLQHKPCLRLENSNVDEVGWYDMQQPISLDLADLPAGLHVLKVISAVWALPQRR